ncbi:MAG: universal stress protein [Flavobacteriales bacterium]
MMRILLLTDFSDSAMHAALYASRVFGRDDVSYVFVHAHFETGYADPMVQAYVPELLETTRIALEDTLTAFRERTGIQGASQELLLGPLPVALDAFAFEHGGDLVVMGQRGKHQNPLFGTNTTAMIKNSPIPVLAVPENAAIRPLQRVLLADDHDVVAPKDLAVLRSIALHTAAEVVVAHVPVSMQEGADHWSNGIYGTGLSGVPLRFIEAHGRDIADALLRSTQKERADMIAVIHRHTGFLGRLFHASMAKELALDGHHPLLVLEQRD